MELRIIINEKNCSTTITSIHSKDEIMNDIISSAIKFSGAKIQKYVIVMSDGKDNGSAKLSDYNKKTLKQSINVVLEELFL